MNYFNITEKSKAETCLCAAAVNVISYHMYNKNMNTWYTWYYWKSSKCSSKSSSVVNAASTLYSSVFPVYNIVACIF